MDWKFLTDEVFELLDSHGLYEGNVDGLDGLVSNFIARIARGYAPDEEYAEDGLDSELDFGDPLDIDPKYDY